MNRIVAKEAILKNLNDAGATFFTSDDLNDSIQDAYDDIVALSQCLVSSVQLNWQNELTYYYFKNLAVTDYLHTIAIFNHNTNRFLCDNASLREMDKFRDDWEIWNGQPEYWIPHTFESVAIVPRPLIATGQFTLYYAKKAPVITLDATDFLFTKHANDLIEEYVTADLLEQAEEFMKAAPFWKSYFEGVIAFKAQCHNIAKADLMLRI